MMRQIPACIRVLAIAAAAIVLLAAPAAAQSVRADSAAADGYAPARTPWDHPDLQGIWDSKTQTPLERPAEFADKEFLTAEEVAALERQTIEAVGRDERAEAGTVADVEGAYNNAFSTFYATQVVETGRTSLIVDPPDGRIPYTADARQRVDAEAGAAAGHARRRGRAGGSPGRPLSRLYAPLHLTAVCVQPAR